MANQWLRLYAEFAHDQKIQMMSEAFQRRYIMLLCIRCSNGDVTLQDDEVTFLLRISNEEWQETKAVFLAKNLIDEDNKPASWDKRQYISDSSATRVAKHREKRKQMGMTATDHIRKDVRARVMAKCENACVYCGSTEDLTIDHLVPTRRGGDNKEENLQIACRVCNADKRHMTHEEYLGWNGRVTLLKRHQKTEAEADTEVNPSLSTGASDQPLSAPATRKGEVCGLLRKAGMSDAAPHYLTDDAWASILAKRTNEEIIEVAKAKMAAMPNQRIGLKYITPALLDDPKPIEERARGSPSFAKSGRQARVDNYAAQAAAARGDYGNEHSTSRTERDITGESVRVA